MKLSKLNEAVKYNEHFKNGVIVYLDKENLKIRLSAPSVEDSELQHTIKTGQDLSKVLKVYKNTDEHTISLINAYLQNDFEAYAQASNAAKLANKDAEFRKAIGAMQLDVMDMAEKAEKAKKSRRG